MFCSCGGGGPRSAASACCHAGDQPGGPGSRAVCSQVSGEAPASMERRPDGNKLSQCTACLQPAGSCWSDLLCWRCMRAELQHLGRLVLLQRKAGLQEGGACQAMQGGDC